MATASPPQARPSRRRRGPGWVPNQHGAWAMLLVPVVLGIVDTGPRPWHALLLVAWLVGYLAFFAAGLWLRSHLKARYLPPVRAYGIAAAAVGGVVVALEPAVLRWAVVYVPLLAVSLHCSWTRDDRSLRNDAVTVLAAGLTAVVAHAPDAALAPFPQVGWLPGGDDPHAWVLAGATVAYFGGTVPYVKTMIRERGNPRMLAVSVGYHAVLLAVTVAVLLVPGVVPTGDRPSAPVTAGLVVLAVALLVRAVVVPRRWPTATPKALGIGEIVASVVLAVLLLAL